MTSPVLTEPPVPAPTGPLPVRALACADAVLDVMPGVMDALRGAMRGQVGEQLSVPQFRCLNFIAHEPGASIGAVAAFLGVTLATASAMVDRLVRAGSVATRPAASDRRRAELHLTSAGQALLQQIRRGARADFARALSGCTAAELQAVLDGMAVLQRAFHSE